MSEVTNSIDKRNHAIGVFIDMRKAFDTVDHELLCAKLETYAIRVVAYDWIKSYLHNRKQYVSLDGYLLHISCGVPQ